MSGFMSLLSEGGEYPPREQVDIPPNRNCRKSTQSAGFWMAGFWMGYERVPKRVNPLDKGKTGWKRWDWNPATGNQEGCIARNLDDMQANVWEWSNHVSLVSYPPLRKGYCKKVIFRSSPASEGLFEQWIQFMKSFNHKYFDSYIPAGALVH